MKTFTQENTVGYSDKALEVANKLADRLKVENDWFGHNKNVQEKILKHVEKYL